jgi:ribonucleoside-diphosphate reductase alpha chain
MFGPQQEFSRDLYTEKYCEPGESIEASFHRVAHGLADDPAHYHNFHDAIANLRFLPGGRIRSSIGSRKETTAYNCFVSGTIDDSFVEGSGSIMARLTEASTTMRMGGGIGYDFSPLRPAKALIKKLLSHSSGPISFMNIYDANGLCCSSAGHRRGAQMGVMRVDHPDIEAFIKAKQPPPEAQALVELLDSMSPADPQYWPLHNALQATLRLKGFNISVALTDRFMEAVVAGKRTFPLVFGGKVVREIDPLELWEQLMRSTWAWAEPGALFIDTINRMNNLRYCEIIAATNPCGEQPLPAHAACLLGSFNLVQYLRPLGLGISRPYFDFDQLRYDIPHAVRAMDNVVDLSRYPLREQEKEAHSKRRMGLGVTGLANALEYMGMPYGSEAFCKSEAQILGFIRDETYRAGVELAKEKGAFPMFEADQYLNGEFIKQLPEDIRHDISTYGIRNSHYTSIAPTGTISFTADNVSSSVEPVFAYQTERTVNRAQGKIKQIIPDYGAGTLGVKGKRCSEVTIQEHLDVLVTAQRYVDSAVSKTCNVPSNTPWADFKGLYVAAWERGCKGVTTYQVGGRRAGILESKDKDESDKVCEIDPATGRRNCE